MRWYCLLIFTIYNPFGQAAVKTDMVMSHLPSGKRISTCELAGLGAKMASSIRLLSATF